MNKWLFLLGFLLLLPACHPEELTCCRTLETKFFTIKTPHQWRFRERQGVDSYVGVIKGPGITVHVDFSNMGFANTFFPSQEEYLHDERPIWTLFKAMEAFSEEGVIYAPYNLEWVKREHEKKRKPGDTTEIIVKAFPSPETSVRDLTEEEQNLYPEAHYMGVMTFEGKTVEVPITIPEETLKHHIKTDSASNFKIKTVWPKETGDGWTGIVFLLPDGHGLLNLTAMDVNAENQAALLKAFKTIEFKRAKKPLENSP